MNIWIEVILWGERQRERERERERGGGSGSGDISWILLYLM